MIRTAFAITLGIAVSAGCDDGVAQAKHEVQTKLAAFQKLIGDRKHPKDHEAIPILDELLAKYPKMIAADQKRFVTGIAACLTKSKIKRDPKKGQDELFRRVTRALGSIGVKGSKPLRTAFTSKKFKARVWDSLRGDMLEQIGAGKDVRSIDLLVDVARRSESDRLRQRAGAALRHFAGASLKQRREISKQLIREWINIDSNARGTTDPALAQQRARSEQRLTVVGSAWNVTLRQLTKQRFRTPQKWQDFYNSPHWRKNWDKMAVASAGKKKSGSRKRRR
jgi:hypothetical protein